MEHQDHRLAGIAEGLGVTQPRLINTGGWANGDVFEGQLGRDRVVVKTYRARQVPLRWLGRYLLARERRAYQALAGVPGVPDLRPCADPDSLIMSFVSGVTIDERLPGGQDKAVVESLRRLVSAMHRRGVFHMDLRNRGNILIDHEGDAVVLDFASAVVVRGRNPLSRAIAALCRRFDRYGLSKWERLSSTSQRHS